MFVNILVTLSVIFAIVSNIPYLLDVIKGKTKPRVVGWGIWATLSTIAMVAAFFDKQYPTAILLLFVTLMDMPIIIFGWKNGDKTIQKLDVYCLVGAIIGLILWWIFNSPGIAVVASLTIDSIGSLPTIIHSWKKPNEETLISFVFGIAKALCTILVLTDWRITASAFPIYLFVVNALITIIIIFRRKYIESKAR